MLGKAVRFLVAMIIVMSPGAPLSAADATMHVFEETHYYEIYGRNIQTLRDEMYKKGPSGIYNPGEVLGATEAYFRIQPYFDSSSGECVLDSVDISLTLTYSIPRWADKRKAPGSLKRKWNRFLEFLWAHEKGHAKIARRGGVIMSERLVRLDPRPTCDEMFAKMIEVQKHVQSKIIAPAQRKYDRRTQRGKSQGAKL